MNRLWLWDLGEKRTTGICHFLCTAKICGKTCPLPCWGYLQKPTLISHPATAVAFPIERKVSFISYNLLCNLRLLIDFNVYLWTERRQAAKEKQKRVNKQNGTSDPSWCSTHSRLDRWQGLCGCIKACIGSNASGSNWNTDQYHFPLCFLFSRPSTAVMNKHDKTSAPVI